MKLKNRRQTTIESRDKILSKFTHGKTKSLKTRKRTLLLEYKMMNKSNKFVDRRIGEKNSNMTADDRVMTRFVAQRVKAYKKIFNLDQYEDILTHKGRTLQVIEKFDNPTSESDDDEDGKLDADFVKNVHFGGGLFTKASGNEMSRQNTIDQLILESKRRKAERQQVKEETQNLTDKLDNDLKDLFPIFDKTIPKSMEELGKVKPNSESYDVLVRQLKLEPVGKPSDRLKSESEICYEEKKKLEMFEKERLERMKRNLDLYEPNKEEPAAKKHISADDLDDGFEMEEFHDEDSSNGEESDKEYDNSNDREIEATEDEEQSDENTEKELKVERSVPKINKHVPIVPQVLDDLFHELYGKTNDEKVEVIENLIKAQRIHCGISVKENLINFFKVLMEFIDSIFVESVLQDSWILASRLCPILFELAQVDGHEVAKIMFNILKTKMQNYVECGKRNISVQTLIVLKIIPLLFPVSDYYHPVVTPMIIFTSQLLSENSCKSMQLIIKGLFLVTLMLECIHLSKRYCSEVMSFLRKVLYISIPDFEATSPPIQSNSKFLVLNKTFKSLKTQNSLRLTHNLLSETVSDDDEKKLSVIYSTIRIISTYYDHYNNFSCSRVMWKSIFNYLSKLPIHLYPFVMNEEIKKVQSKIKTSFEGPLHYLLAEKKRPKALRLYEPNIRPVIDGKSFRTVSRNELEKAKLVHRYKKEMKGAVREIRKDKEFLARVKISEQTKKDAERKEKVKKIFAWGQNQQSEFKRMERRNRHRK